MSSEHQALFKDIELSIPRLFPHREDRQVGETDDRHCKEYVIANYSNARRETRVVGEGLTVALNLD